MVGTFNKEKAQEGAFFGHSETLWRFIDSSILLADISPSTAGSWSIVLPHRCWLNVNDVGCCDTTLLTPCNWGLPRHRADLRAAGRPGPGEFTTLWQHDVEIYSNPSFKCGGQSVHSFNLDKNDPPLCRYLDSSNILRHPSSWQDIYALSHAPGSKTLRYF